MGTVALATDKTRAWIALRRSALVTLVAESALISETGTTVIASLAYIVPAEGAAND